MRNSIFLAEGDPADEEMIKRQFRLNHVLNEILVFRDGEEALDYLMGWGIFRGRDPSLLPGLVLLELDLPKRSGFDVLRHLGTAPFAGRVPVMTMSSARNDCAEHVMRLGAKTHLKKPVSFTALQAACRPLGFQWLRMTEEV